MEARIPRVIIAGTNSGCGKTTVTCGIMQALVNRGLDTGAFKCGPDYIDTMFHSRITGSESTNLDLVFFTKNTLRYLLAENGRNRDINIIEGVMGFYDGMGLDTVKASTYEVSQCTRTPVVLVVNARGAAMSVLATVQGFLSLYPDNMVRGVILNQCSAMSYPALKKAMEDYFSGRIRPLGFLPPMKDCTLESRHLGLVTAAEVEGLREKLEIMGAQTEKTVDLEGLMELARDAEPLFYDDIPVPRMEQTVRIAVAKDRAFCFYYHDNLKLLEKMGAELVFFSPLKDRSLPEKIQGLYLGGGYPELYSEGLSRNTTMLESVKKAITGGLPCIAECGGFMYLTEAIGEAPMAGSLPGTCFDTGKLTRFGYVTLEAKKDNLLCAAGQSIRAHEFHHWDCTEPGDGFRAVKPTGRSWDCAVSTDRLYAGYPHFHFYSNPEFAVNFYKSCTQYKGEQSHD